MLIFSLTNCSEEITDSEVAKSTNVFSIARSDIDQYDSSTLSSPPKDVIVAIKEDLGNQEWFRQNYSNIHGIYGSIRWNYAYFSVNDEHRYLISLPFVSADHKILGIMFVQGHDDHYDYSFRSRNFLIDTATDDGYGYEDAITNLALVTLNSLEISRNHIVIDKYNTFAKNYGEYANSISTPRSYSVTWTTIGWSGTYDGWPIAELTEHKAILPCGGDSGGGGSPLGDFFNEENDPDNNSGGNNNNNDNSNDGREVIIEEIENLLANLEECDKISLSAEAKELIADQANIMDPCQPDKTAQELIEELISELCNSKDGINVTGGEITDFDNIDIEGGIIDEGDVESILDDHITIIDETLPCSEDGLSMSEDCKRLSNILDDVIGPDGSSPKCKLLDNLGETITDVRFMWDCNNSFIKKRPNIGTYPDAQTKPLPEDGQISVYFGPEICDKSCIEILSHVIHESVHALVFTLAFDKLPPELEGHFPSANSFHNILNEIKRDDFNNANNLHSIMAEFYANQYANAMWEMVGMVGTPDDYLFWAYDGLGIDPSLLLNSSDWTSIENSWNNIKDDINYNCDE